MRNDPKVLEIEAATPDDVGPIEDVRYRAWLVTYPNAGHGITADDIHDRFKDRNVAEKLEKRRQQLANPPKGSTMLVARFEDRVVGFCHVIQHDDRNQVTAIYIDPNFHSMGIGTALWNAAESHLDGTKPTYVEVATYNENAIKFYEKLGFKDTGKRMSDPRFTMKSGNVIPAMEMLLSRPPF